MGGLPPHRRHSRPPRGRRDAARAVRQAGGRLPHLPPVAAGDHRQQQPGPQVGYVGALRRARPRRTDDVRPDDRRELDLHRHTGHPPGHVRDVRVGGSQALRRLAGRHDHAHRRPRRHGRRAAPSRHAQRRGRSRGGGRPGAYRAPHRDSLPRHLDRGPGRRPAPGGGGEGGASRPVARPARQRRRGAARAGEARLHARARHGSDLGPRPSLRLRAPFRPRRGPGEGARRRPTRLQGARAGRDGRALPRDRDDAGARRRRLRLRQQPARLRPRGRLRGRLRLPGLRPRVHTRPVLRGAGTVPLGGAVGRPGGHLPHRSGAPGAVPGRRWPAPLADRGGEDVRVPGPAGAHLLARLPGARPRRSAVQRARALG